MPLNSPPFHDEIQTGDIVIMPEPLATDCFTHGNWRGKVTAIRGTILEVENRHGEKFSIERNRIKVWY